MAPDPRIRSPGVRHWLGRALGTRYRGIKGVDALLRFLHHPDHRQHSWVETEAAGLPGGPRYHLSTRWFCEWTTWFYGSLDAEIHQWIMSHARQDWVVFDIGMNFGFFACLLAQRCAAVHGFEPVDWLAGRARANAELNHLRNLSTAQIALSDHAGKGRLKLPSGQDANWGTSTLVRQETEVAAFVEVTLDTIDAYAERRGLSRLDFIKLDVEGAEHLVLAGAPRTLQRYRPAIIFERNAESLKSILELLRPLDYRFHDLHERNLPNDIEKWPSDILALPKPSQIP